MLTPTTGITLEDYNAAVLAGGHTHARLVFPVQSITLTGADISASGGLRITDLMNPDSDMMFGTSTSRELVVYLLNGDIFNGFDWTEEFRVDFGVDINGSTKWVTVGYFKGKRPTRINRVDVIEFTAYDRMQMFSEVADEFLDTLTYPITLGDIYHNLCTYIGINYEVGNEIADAMSVQYDECPFDRGITNRALLSYIAQANGCYAVITADGNVKLKWFSDQTSNYSITGQDYFEIVIGEEDAPVIDAVRIGSTDPDESGFIYPISGYNNVFEIINNPLLLNMSVADKTAVITAMLSRFSAFGAYKAMSVSVVGNWMVEAGDIIDVVYDGNETASMPIFTKQMLWNGGCNDFYECTGQSEREDVSNNVAEEYRRDGKYYRVRSGVDIADDGVTVSGGKFVKINSGGVFEVQSQNLDINSVLGYIEFKETEGGAKKHILIGHGGAGPNSLTTIYDMANNSANPYSSVSFQDMYCSDPARHKSVSMRLGMRDFGDGLGNLLCITGRTGIYNQQTHEQELDTNIVNFFGNIFKGVAMYADDLHCLFQDIDSPITWDSSVVNVSSCDCVMTGNGSFKYMKLTVSLKNNVSAWTVIGTLNAALVPHKTILGLAATIGDSPSVKNIQIQTNGNIRIRSGNASTTYYWDVFYPHNAFVRE